VAPKDGGNYLEFVTFSGLNAMVIDVKDDIGHRLGCQSDKNFIQEAHKTIVIRSRINDEKLRKNSNLPLLLESLLCGILLLRYSVVFYSLYDYPPFARLCVSRAKQ